MLEQNHPQVGETDQTRTWSLTLDKKVGGAAGPCSVAPGDEGRNDPSRPVTCRELAPAAPQCRGLYVDEQFSTT